MPLTGFEIAGIILAKFWMVWISMIVVYVASIYYKISDFDCELHRSRSVLVEVLLERDRGDLSFKPSTVVLRLGVAAVAICAFSGEKMKFQRVKTHFRLGELP